MYLIFKYIFNMKKILKILRDVMRIFFAWISFSILSDHESKIFYYTSRNLWRSQKYGLPITIAYKSECLKNYAIDHRNALRSVQLDVGLQRVEYVP